MALFRPVVRTSDTIAVAYFGDPCVTVPEGEVGWVPAESCVLDEVDGHTADVVQIRGLSPTEHVVCDDAGGMRARAFARAKKGVVRVNGSANRKVIETWLDQVALHDAGGALVLLGVVVGALTQGSDPRKLQRVALGQDEDEVVPPGPADAAPPAEKKS